MYNDSLILLLWFTRMFLLWLWFQFHKRQFIIPTTSTKLKGGYTGFTLSVCPSVDRIMSALYLQQYSLGGEIFFDLVMIPQVLSHEKVKIGMCPNWSQKFWIVQNCQDPFPINHNHQNAILYFLKIYPNLQSRGQSGCEMWLGPGFSGLCLLDPLAWVTWYAMVVRDLGVLTLTHWGCDKMTAVFQMTFSNGFSWMKMFPFWWNLHWRLFPRSNYQYSSTDSDNGLAPSWRQAIMWTKDG